MGATIGDKNDHTWFIWITLLVLSHEFRIEPGREDAHLNWLQVRVHFPENEFKGIPM